MISVSLVICFFNSAANLAELPLFERILAWGWRSKLWWSWWCHLYQGRICACGEHVESSWACWKQSLLWGWGEVLSLRAWISVKQANEEKHWFLPRTGSLLLEYEIYLFWSFKRISSLTSFHSSEQLSSERSFWRTSLILAQTVTEWHFSHYLQSPWEMFTRNSVCSLSFLWLKTFLTWIFLSLGRLGL